MFYLYPNSVVDTKIAFVEYIVPGSKGVEADSVLVPGRWEF